ncbi:MAG: radical SAM protein [Candidatus Omnitrophica bacterium]|nr:radical SAM protein [Candidatus Omnitrophota bacterium]
MKIIIGYPPLASDNKGTPLLSQNRQFQYFKAPTYIYPVVPATAATLLKKAGHEVIWKDAIAEGLTYQQFLDFIKKERPELIAFETKTPVVQQHWKIINDLRSLVTGYRPLTVLFGDHVTALPEESFQNSQVDFVLTGGDYDFLLSNLVSALSNKTALEKGIYYRENGQLKNTGRFHLQHDLNSLPFIDRELTRWDLYAYKNGNYKTTPGAYIMSGRDCWYHECTFCSWPTLYPEFRVRKVDNVLEEIGILIDKYGVKEIMDDTGTFPKGDWLKNFCLGIIERGWNNKVYLDCNMRFGVLNEDEYRLMKKANFRLILFGLESANQRTLDRIHKGLKVEDIVESCRSCRKAGLFPHITIMFGYPWETYEEALNTWKLGEWLLKKGYAYTMQATVVIPYPGSPLFEECKTAGLLKTLDWQDYDMKQLVMKTDVAEEKIMDLVQRMYRISFNPEFVMRKLFSLRDAEDLKYSLRAAKKVMGHIFDFSK